MNITFKPKIVVLGMISNDPVAGVIWQTVHYLLGFQRLGFDTYYIEDHGMPPTKLMRGDDEDGSVAAASFIRGIMERFDLDNSWAYHALHSDGAFYGMSAAQLQQLYGSAALIINLHGATVPLPEHVATKRLVYLETDPVVIQIQVHQKMQDTIDYLAPHIAFYTFGENYGQPDCKLPVSSRFQFKPTRQPVILDLWEPHGTSQAEVFTTIGNWRQTGMGKEVTFNGEVYQWSKHFEFLKFIDLPRRVPQAFELALSSSSCNASEKQLLESKGWQIRDALEFSSDLDEYRQYIGNSRGEFTVAKEQNIRLRTGWFSDRAATYLAAGRPVITQETAFSQILPTGEGLFAFSTMNEIVAAVEAINGDYERHRRGALRVARECFSHDVVLTPLLADLGISRPSSACGAYAPRVPSSAPPLFAAPLPALSPSDGERVASGRVRGILQGSTAPGTSIFTVEDGIQNGNPEPSVRTPMAEAETVALPSNLVLMPSSRLPLRLPDETVRTALGLPPPVAVYSERGARASRAQSSASPPNTGSTAGVSMKCDASTTDETVERCARPLPLLGERAGVRPNSTSDSIFTDEGRDDVGFETQKREPSAGTPMAANGTAALPGQEQPERDRCEGAPTHTRGACAPQNSEPSGDMKGQQTSIIMVTYNGLPYTKMCLTSLLTNGWNPNDELIVVDNGSTDGTPAYLRDVMRLNPFIRVVFNEQNRGFAAANNQGLGLASGAVFILLNNDTLVPRGWRDGLLRWLDDPSIGMIGPVTNRICNEAQIDAPYRTYGEMELFAHEYTERHHRAGGDIRMLAMFCVAIRRDVFEQIGPLDEQFGIGMFEDEDYSLQIRRAGYRIVCAEDVFVHHFSQASFGELCGTGEFDRLLESNRRQLEEKWGMKWQPHARRINPEYQRIRHRIPEIATTHLPSGATVLVVSKGDEELLKLNGHRAWHFPQLVDGQYPNIYPAHSAEAIEHLEALRVQGGGFFLIPKPGFWWLDHYSDFKDHLERNYRLAVRDDETCLIFDLRTSIAERETPRIPISSGQTPVLPSIKSSIIIPAFNHEKLTAQCLKTLLKTVPADVEVIVVDDASNDTTPAMLASFGERIRVVRHRDNTGFATSCNDGAAAASGDFLVFLNNDTIPQPGWLDALVRYGESHPQAAVIGGKLLYPNNTIQHAGVVICQDRYPRHIYTGFPADHPAVNKSRRFQIVTAACMLVRGALFDEAGGFDAAYRNGLEDVDFCLRLGEAGHEIHYCAECMVQHLESVSPGRFKNDRDNVALYRQRWMERVRPDDVQYYLQDGLMRFAYEGRYPVNLEVSPLLAALDGQERNAHLERLLEKRGREVAGLMRENTRLSLELRNQAPDSPELRYQELRRQIREGVQRFVPKGATVLVISKGDDSLLDLPGYQGWHFPRTERGTYAGHHPADSGEAIAQLEAARLKGAEYLLIPATSLWWLEHYADFRLHLDTRFIRLEEVGKSGLIYSLCDPVSGNY